jgi:hypothetical protein
MVSLNLKNMAGTEFLFQSKKQRLENDLGSARSRENFSAFQSGGRILVLGRKVK